MIKKNAIECLHQIYCANQERLQNDAAYEKAEKEFTAVLHERFNDQMRDIIYTRFGLENDAPASLLTVAAKHNKTRERIRQLLEKAKRILNHAEYRERILGHIANDRYKEDPNYN